MARRDNRTPDLFEGAPLYPVRRPSDRTEPFNFDGKLKRAISRALKECDLTREMVAARMAEILDQPTFSKFMLDAYTAESRETHKITVERFVALVKVTGATWLLDVLAEPVGCIVMEGEEARLAERGYIRQQMKELQRRERELDKAPPVHIRRRLA